MVTADAAGTVCCPSAGGGEVALHRRLLVRRRRSHPCELDSSRLPLSCVVSPVWFCVRWVCSSSGLGWREASPSHRPRKFRCRPTGSLGGEARRGDERATPHTRTHAHVRTTCHHEWRSTCTLLAATARPGRHVSAADHGGVLPRTGRICKGEANETAYSDQDERTRSTTSAHPLTSLAFALCLPVSLLPSPSSLMRRCRPQFPRSPPRRWSMIPTILLSGLSGMPSCHRASIPPSVRTCTVRVLT